MSGGEVLQAMGGPLKLLGQLGHIFYFIVLPMLLTAAVGYFLQKTVTLDRHTLKRLNFHFVMPGMIYYSIVTSRITAAQVGTIVAFVVTLMACTILLTVVVARVRGIPHRYRNTMVLTTMLYNTGNFSIPLQERAFSGTGLSDNAMGMQALVMITQNLLTFTLGIFIAAGGRKDRHWKENLLHIAKLPPIYAIAAAALTVQVRNSLGEIPPVFLQVVEPWWKVVLYVKEAFFGVALLTLGAQLATVRRGEDRYPVRWSVFMRLLLGPMVAVGIIYGFGLSGFIAQMLLIASSAPTAVNCMLLCLEFDSNPDYAATAVLYSSLLSPITVTLVIFFAQGGFLPGFGF